MTTETSRSKDDTLRTSDLTLAAYLIMNDCRPELVKLGERANGYPVGGWLFDRGCAEPYVRRFNDGEACVDPTKFHRQLTRARSDLFDFLGIGKPKVSEQIGS